MNDVPIHPHDETKIRILALGDSHTFAIGADMNQTWVKVLERELNECSCSREVRCYNAAAIGYSLHQYLLRLIDQGQLLKPHYVLVGLSHATDLYDLLPPDRGGWIYGGNNAREYFDFDKDGNLVDIQWEPATESKYSPSVTRKVRQLLEHFATFRYLRRSKLALFVGSHVRLGGKTLWPNMEVVVEKRLSVEHEYHWRLAEAILERINDETKKLKAELIIVGIPYIAQVYDDIWDMTFGGDPRFERTVAKERMEAWCRSKGIRYVDTLDAFRNRVEETGRWMHYRRDAHPTPEGHDLIAQTVLQADVISLCLVQGKPKTGQR